MVRPIPIRPAATSAKIHSGSPVNGSRVEAIDPPRRVVVPRTPPAGFAFVCLSATTAPFTPSAAAGVAVDEDVAGVMVACAPRTAPAAGAAAAGVTVAEAAGVTVAEAAGVTVAEAAGVTVAEAAGVSVAAGAAGAAAAAAAGATVQ